MRFEYGKQVLASLGLEADGVREHREGERLGELARGVELGALQHAVDQLVGLPLEALGQAAHHALAEDRRHDAAVLRMARWIVLQDHAGLAPVLGRLGVGDAGAGRGLEGLVVAEDLLHDVVAAGEPDAVLLDPDDGTGFADGDVHFQRTAQAIPGERIDVEDDGSAGDSLLTHEISHVSRLSRKDPLVRAGRRPAGVAV